MSSARTSIGNAFKTGTGNAGRSMKEIGHKVGGLSRSIKSAFKSAFLMAGLYAAFRGVKSLIENAATQNEEFSKSLNLIKANLLVAFTPIMQAIMPALNLLASGFAAVTQQIATATAGLFGQTYAQAASATKKLQGVTSTAKKAAGTLASFDALNTMSSDNSDSSTGTALSALDTAQYANASDFGKTVQDMLTQAASAVGPGIALILQKIAAAAPAVITAGVGIITALLTGLNQNFPSILSSGMSILQTLINGMWQIIPQLGPLITNVITFLLTGFLTGAPQLFAMGVTLLSNVLQGLVQQLPTLIPIAQQAVMTIVQSITQNLPAILQAGITILVSLAQGLAQMLPTLIPMAVSCILTLVQTLMDNLPSIIDAAIQIIVALTLGIIDSLPKIVEMAPKIIASLVTGLVSAIPKLIDASIQIITKFIDFLTSHPEQIAESGVEIIISLVTGLIKAIPQLVMAGPKIVQAIIDMILKTDWIAVGGEIIKGIGKGLLDSAGSLKDAFGSIGSALFGGGGASVSVPKMASGGVVSAPTLAMVGEYSGARSNPEVVAPLDKLQAMLGGGGAADVTLLYRIIALLEKILAALGAGQNLTANIYMNNTLLQNITALLIRGGYLTNA